MKNVKRGQQIQLQEEVSHANIFKQTESQLEEQYIEVVHQQKESGEIEYKQQEKQYPMSQKFTSKVKKSATYHLLNPLKEEEDGFIDYIQQCQWCRGYSRNLIRVCNCVRLHSQCSKVWIQQKSKTNEVRWVHNDLYELRCEKCNIAIKFTAKLGLKCKQSKQAIRKERQKKQKQNQERCKKRKGKEAEAQVQKIQRVEYLMNKKNLAYSFTIIGFFVFFSLVLLIFLVLFGVVLADPSNSTASQSNRNLLLLSLIFMSYLVLALVKQKFIQAMKWMFCCQCRTQIMDVHRFDPDR